MSSLSSASDEAEVSAQLDVLYSLFAKNINGSGEDGMGIAELTNFLRALDAGASESEGSHSGSGAPVEASALMAAMLVGRYDSRNVGSLTAADFRLLLSSEGLAGLAGASSSAADAMADELARVFTACDLDGDGLLDRHDVRRIIESDGSKVTDREVDEILEQTSDIVGESHMTLEGFYELSRTQGW